MVKRGEGKVKVSHGRKPKMPLKAQHPKKAARRSASVSAAIMRDEAAEINAADRILAKEERVIKREVRFILSPEEFHVVTFVSSLIILSFLFASMSILFYAVLTIAALLFAHFLREHHRPHDVITILGVFFLPLAITLAAFRDWLVLLLLAIYIISAVSAVIIYHHHRKAHALLKIMWQVTYSRVVAVTLALLLACILPLFIFPDAFLSVLEMVFLFVMPVAFLFFFASKFLYIYFFDRVHIRSDFLRSLRHTITYTLVFVVLLMCMYSLLAVGFYNSRAGDYRAYLDKALIDVSNIEKVVARNPDIGQLAVTDGLLALAADLREEISVEKSREDERMISFADILDDSFFVSMSDAVLNTIRFTVLNFELLSLKSDIVEWTGNLTATANNNLTFPDGSGTIEDYTANLKSYVEEGFVDFSQSPEVVDLVAKLDDPSTSYSYFDGGGLFYWFAKNARLDFVYDSESMFGRQMSIVVRHSEPFRQMARLSINVIVFTNSERASQSSIRRLYVDRESDLLPMSGAVRYSIIKDDIDSRAERLKSVGRISFEVD
ncbi:UbiA prenyltransferase family protein [Candidatus Woesearchaeota archaeon]|nr:UbiA prenyltransferase family protein [Candidatus Woesearchaeota archaeon]